MWDARQDVKDGFTASEWTSGHHSALTALVECEEHATIAAKLILEKLPREGGPVLNELSIQCDLSV